MYMASTKLIVLKSKELIYTFILLALIAVFIIIMIYMFRGRSDEKKEAKPAMSSAAEELHYTPGTYTADMSLGETTITVMVTVDTDYITDVSFAQTDETVKTMYPLLETALEDINTQLHYVSSVDDIVPSEESSYTTMLIVSAIRTALMNAVVN